MSSRRRTRRSVPETTQQDEGDRLDHLVVMRESALYDEVLMEGMIQQTLAKVSSLPGAVELMAAGTDVFRHPKKWGAHVKRAGNSQMAMVEREGVLYLYSMGSAATDDINDTNAFVRELIGVLVTYRPRESSVSSFTRLTRSANYVGDLMRAFSENSHLLHCEAEIDLSTPEGKMLFQMLGMIAAMERDYIVRRHTAGRVNQWRRGDWVPNAYPPGYFVEGGKLVLNPDEIDATREMLRILANPSLGVSDCASALGDLGIVTPMLKRLHGAQATVADARNPSAVIATLLGWAQSYENGRHETLWPNPFPGVSDIAGVRVEEIDGFDHGALRLVQEMPQPDGGWADGATFDGIRLRMASTPVTGGASRTHVPPFSGLFRFIDDGYEHAVGTTNRNYTLLRRPLDPERIYVGWNAESETSHERVAVVDRASWHRSVADAIVEAMRAGVPAELDFTRFQAAGSLPPLHPGRAKRRALQLRLEEAKENLRRAHRNAREAEADGAASLFIEDVKRFHSEVEHLDSEINALDSASVEPALTGAFESCADLVVQAIAALANSGGSSPSSLRDALRTVLHDEKWELDGDVVRWEFKLEIPHDEGTVLLGPIRGQVPNRRPTPARTASRYTRLKARDQLVAEGLGERASECVAASGQPLIAEVLLAHLHQSERPKEADPEWAKLIIAVYADPAFLWTRNKWRQADEVRRTVLQSLESAGGTLPIDSLVAQGLNPEQIRYLWRVKATPTGQPIIRRVSGAVTPQVALLTCPHCGGMASHSVVTPETVPGVLCCERSSNPVARDRRKRERGGCWSVWLRTRGFGQRFGVA
jgi:hypothetical protein